MLSVVVMGGLRAGRRETRSDVEGYHVLAIAKSHDKNASGSHIVFIVPYRY